MLRSNERQKKDDPVVVVRADGGKEVHCHRCEILGPSTVVHAPKGKHIDGAHVAVVTESQVRMFLRDGSRVVE
jgi:hypothetical protein